MAYRFVSTTVEQLRRDGERRARMRSRAEKGLARVRRGGPAPRLQRRLVVSPPSRGTTGNPAAPPAAVVTLTRLGFGPTAADVASFGALGGDDEARLEAWLGQQLDPGSIDDGAAEVRIAQAGFTTLGKSLAQLWADHVVPDGLPWEEVVRPFHETERVTFLRAIHSRRQLFEVMVDFWHNHFNVYAHDWPSASVWPHSDRDAIRAHALGNFRELLEAVARTPAMLFYLDNVVNSAEDANENFGREMLELHTMGVESYLGSLPQDEVPLDGEGVPVGWVEEDVIAAARCLTGWTVDTEWTGPGTNTGLFAFWDPWHDDGPKTVIGVDLPAGQGIEDGLALFDRVATHPATARHVAGKLCRRLVQDFPPVEMVEAAAATFLAHTAAPDQIARVVETIVLWPGFLATWGEKVKRPFEIAVSAFRGAGGDLPFTTDDWATDWFLWELYQTGQPLFSWHPPNGYPDVRFAWNSTSPRVMSWRLANMLVEVEADGGPFYFDVLGQTPAGVRSAREIVEYWSGRILGRALPPAEYDELESFMAQGVNPEFDLPLDTDDEVRDRLRALVALFFMSPSFLWR